MKCQKMMLLVWPMSKENEIMKEVIEEALENASTPTLVKLIPIILKK